MTIATWLEASPVLESKHIALLQNVDRICEVSGVAKKFIPQPMSKACTEKEIDFLRGLLSSDKDGLLIENSNDPIQAGHSIGAALLRNYIDVKVLSLGELIDFEGVDDVLICPDFCTGVAMAEWDRDKVFRIMSTRMVHDLKSILFINSMSSMRKLYGDKRCDHFL